MIGCGFIVIVPVGFRRHPEEALELAIKIFLAPVTLIQRHRFDLHTGANVGGAEHHPRTCNVLMNSDTDLVAK
jgi:hypothetical protein